MGGGAGVSIDQTIISTLKGFGVAAEVAEVHRGAAVDRYALRLTPGTRVKQVTALADDIAVAIAAPGVRILPIPGTRFVGIEVPASERKVIRLEDVQPEQDHPLRFPVGVSVDGKGVSARVDKLPHLLVAGATGSGKSVFVTAMLAHLVNHAQPADLQLILIDPKRVELAPFAHVPHLAMPPATDVSSAIEALDWAVAAMDERWVTLQQAGRKQISELADPPPYLLVVVDELADLMMTAGKRAEASIVRLLQLGRAAGVHLVLATQRPSTDVITGLIKTNTPSRMVFSVTSHTDSNVALGQSGAEKLLGQGDGLWWPAGASQPERIQGVFIDTDDLELPESNEERDERVKASMFAAVREYSQPEDEPEPATEPAPSAPDPVRPDTGNLEAVPLDTGNLEAVPLDTGNLEAVPLLPEPARELFDPDLDRVIEAAYRKGRDHGRILAYSPPVTHRVMIPSDWWWAVALFVVGTLAGAVALPALPLAAGVWLAVTVVTRRRTMDRYEAFSRERAMSR